MPSLGLCPCGTALQRLVNSFHTFGTSCQTAFPRGCSNFHSHQQHARMPAQPPYSPRDGSSSWTAALPCQGGQGESRKWFCPRCQHDDPRPRTAAVVFNKPGSQNRTCQEKEKQSKQGKKKNLSAGKNTHIHRLK